MDYLGSLLLRNTLILCEDLEANAFHMRTDLLRDFLEHLFCEVAFDKALVVLDKLDDVTGRCDTIRVSKATVITIKSLHRGEIGIAHSYNNDRARQQRQLTEDIPSLWHVMDCSISQ